MMNVEDHPIWSTCRGISLGWEVVGVVGFRSKCLDYVEQAWIDMRPKSIKNAKNQQSPYIVTKKSYKPMELYFFVAVKFCRKCYRDFLERLNFEFTSYRRRLARTELDSRFHLSTECPSDQLIVLHRELSFSNSNPKYLFFYCDPLVREGEKTQLADGRELTNVFL